MMPWDDPTVARGLDAGWRDPRNADDLQRLMTHVVAALPSGGTVLDYGCGTGRACVHFHPDRYVGFDTSDAMLAIARSRFPQYRFLLALPEWIRGSHREAFADVVFSNSVVQYQPPDRWEATLRDIADRARVAALIETYDAPPSANLTMGPVQRTGGSNAPIWIWPSCSHHRVLESFGTVARLMLGDDGPVLYTVTR